MYQLKKLLELVDILVAKEVATNESFRYCSCESTRWILVRIVGDKTIQGRYEFFSTDISKRRCNKSRKRYKGVAKGPSLRTGYNQHDSSQTVQRHYTAASTPAPPSLAPS